jgi:hypothetical protein
MNRYHTAHMTIDEHYGDSIRLVGSCRPEDAPIGMTEAVLIIDDCDGTTRDIGPYPARVGAYWSDQRHGMAGYYLLFGPIPLADLNAEWQGEARVYAETRRSAEFADYDPREQLTDGARQIR